MTFIVGHYVEHAGKRIRHELQHKTVELSYCEGQDTFRILGDFARPTVRVPLSDVEPLRIALAGLSQLLALPEEERVAHAHAHFTVSLNGQGKQ